MKKLENGGKFHLFGKLGKWDWPITQVKQGCDQHVLTFNRTIRSHITRAAIKCCNRRTCCEHGNCPTGGKNNLLTPLFFQTLFMSFGYQSIVHSFRLAVQRNQRRRPGMPGCRVEKKAPWERGETKTKQKKKPQKNKQNSLDVLSLVCISPFFPSVVTEAIEEGRGYARVREERPSSFSEFSATPAFPVARCRSRRVWMGGA